MEDDYGSKVAAGGDYGSYGAADGGYGYEKIVDCNSALGLIGLLGLIELLRDIIGNVIKQSEKKEMRRRRRSAEGDAPGSSGSLLEYFSGGGAAHLLHTLPATLLPLLHNMVDVNDGLESPACLEHSVCQANQAFLARAPNNSTSDTTFGDTVGGLVSSLLTQVASRSLTSDQETYRRALRAGEVGRNGGDCRQAFMDCPELKPRHTPRPGVKVTTLLYDHLVQGSRLRPSSTTTSSWDLGYDPSLRPPRPGV
ncbi:uncharacterized protein [Procambarus clarkii]|uniref:uncharacterized protein n=1 Tax=Procambarus clarkii TaxID=6728 RepID=UPI001E673A81|nr:uncharacterized protein LOC123756547 [Procambarus clarkii]